MCSVLVFGHPCMCVLRTVCVSLSVLRIVCVCVCDVCIVHKLLDVFLVTTIMIILYIVVTVYEKVTSNPLVHQRIIDKYWLHVCTVTKQKRSSRRVQSLSTCAGLKR